MPTHRVPIPLRSPDLTWTRIPNGGVCVYCGQPALGEWDHFLPVSLADLFASLYSISSALYLVPCCHSCNSRATNELFHNLTLKQEYIHAGLRKEILACSRDPALEAQFLLLVSRTQWKIIDNPAAAELLRVEFKLPEDPYILDQLRSIFRVEPRGRAIERSIREAKVEAWLQQQKIRQIELSRDRRIRTQMWRQRIDENKHK